MKKKKNKFFFLHQQEKENIIFLNGFHATNVCKEKTMLLFVLIGMRIFCLYLLHEGKYRKEPDEQWLNYSFYFHAILCYASRDVECVCSVKLSTGIGGAIWRWSLCDVNFAKLCPKANSCDFSFFKLFFWYMHFLTDIADANGSIIFYECTT